MFARTSLHMRVVGDPSLIECSPRNPALPVRCHLSAMQANAGMIAQRMSQEFGAASSTITIRLT
jgi:hypothetical protein